VGLRFSVGLVTGATGVLGRAAALRIARGGASLFLHYHRNTEALRRLLNRLGPSVVGHEAQDLSRPSGIAALAERIESLPRLDFLVLAHGATAYRPLPLFTEDELERLVALNLTSHMVLIRAAYDRLRRSRGTVILIGSVAQLLGSSCEIPYAAAKAGLTGLAAALRAEVGEEGVRALVLLPGAFPSPMTEGRALPPLLPTTTAEAVAEEIVRVLESEGPVPLLRVVGRKA